MKRVLRMLAATVLMAAGGAHAQSTLTLEQALSIGLEKNYGIRIAREQVNQLANDVTPGNAGMLPNVNVDAARNYTVTNVNQTFQDGRVLATSGVKANSYSLGARLDWTLFDGMGMFLDYERLGKLKEIGEEQYRLQVEAMLADITVTYADLVRQQVLLDVLNESIGISRDRLKIAEDKFDVGSGARVEVLQARVALNEDESAAQNQQVALRGTQILLNTLLGREPEEEFMAADSIALAREVDLAGVLADAMAENPRVMIARHNADLAQLNTRLIFAERFPVVAGNLGYTMTGSENQAGFFVEQNNKGLNYGLTARLPLFNGFNVNRRAQNARIGEKIAALELEEVVNQVSAEIQQIYTAYQNALQLIDLEQENLLVAEENAAIALDRFLLGTYTPVELREAQRALLDTESRLLSARFNAKASETRLLQLAGRVLGQGNR